MLHCRRTKGALYGTSEDEKRTLSYKKLLHKMVDLDLSMKELRLRYSSNTATKIRNHEPVNIAILVDICEWLDCDIGDIVFVVPKEPEKPLERDIWSTFGDDE